VRKKTNWLIVHSSATPPHMDIGVKEIKRWHVERGFTTTGYHFVIRRNGLMEVGRAIAEQGAHVFGRNNDSVGICLVGGVNKERAAENNFTEEQFEQLKIILEALLKVYPDAKVRGHRDFANTDCPSFDAVTWANARGLPT
jgi:N-acetylmuramoyl-L-alanine amidase